MRNNVLLKFVNKSPNQIYSQKETIDSVRYDPDHHAEIINHRDTFLFKSEKKNNVMCKSVTCQNVNPVKNKSQENLGWYIHLGYGVPSQIQIPENVLFLIDIT